MLGATRQDQATSLHFLQPIPEHRTVDLRENISADVDARVGIDADDVRVVRGMMDLAQAEAIGDQGLAARIAILEDVQRREASA